MFNRRYAVLGWLVWQVGKRVGKRKAKAAVPSLDPETKRPNRPAIVSGIAGLAATAWVAGKLKRRGGSGESSE